MWGDKLDGEVVKKARHPSLSVLNPLTAGVATWARRAFPKPRRQVVFRCFVGSSVRGGGRLQRSPPHVLFVLWVRFG